MRLTVVSFCLCCGNKHLTCLLLTYYLMFQERAMLTWAASGLLRFLPMQRIRKWLQLLHCVRLPLQPGLCCCRFQKNVLEPFHIRPRFRVAVWRFLDISPHSFHPRCLAASHQRSRPTLSQPPIHLEIKIFTTQGIYRLFEYI